MIMAKTQHQTNEESSIKNAEFNEFLQHPEKHDISERALIILENTGSVLDIPKKYILNFVLTYSDGFCSMMGYYDAPTIWLTDFMTKPEGKGIAQRSLAELKHIFKKKGLHLDIIMDVIDEARVFWDKMAKQNLIGY